MKRLRTLATCWKTMSSINDHELCSSDDFKQWWWLSWTDDHGWPMNDEFSQYWWVMSDDFSQHWWAMSSQHKKLLKLPKKQVKVFWRQSQSLPQTCFFCQQLMKTWMILCCQWFVFHTNDAPKIFCCYYPQLWSCKLYIHV